MENNNLPDKNEMTATVKLSYSEIHRLIETLMYTIQMRDESDGPAMKGLKSLKKDIANIKESMDRLYHNKVIDGDRAPDTVTVPPSNCDECED
jgi:hypothetical protein